MALLHVQCSYQAKTLSQLRPHNSTVWFRMLALNGEGCQNSPHFTPRASSVYYASFGLMLSRIKISLNGVELKQWLPSWWEDAGGGLATSLVKKLPLWKTALHWMLEGKRKRGRPKITRRWTVEKEIKEMGKTWGGIKLMGRDRQMWREHVAALHAT